MSDASEVCLKSAVESLEPALPPEILLEVMDQLADFRWKRTLVNLMLSNRAAYDLGLLPFMRFVELETKKASEDFVAGALDGKLELIRHMKIDRHFIWRDHVDFLVKIVPHLKSLYVDGFAWAESWWIWKMLPAASTRLKKLELYYDPLLDWEILSKPNGNPIFYLSPSIEHLVLHCYDRNGCYQGLFRSFEVLAGTDLPNLKTVDLWNVCDKRLLALLPQFLSFARKIAGLGVHEGPEEHTRCLSNLERSNCPNLPRSKPEARAATTGLTSMFPSFPTSKSWKSAVLLPKFRSSSMPNSTLQRIEIRSPSWTLSTDQFDAVRQGLGSMQIRVIFHDLTNPLNGEEEEEVRFWKSLRTVTWSLKRKSRPSWL